MNEKNTGDELNPRGMFNSPGIDVVYNSVTFSEFSETSDDPVLKSGKNAGCRKDGMVNCDVRKEIRYTWRKKSKFVQLKPAMCFWELA